MDIGQTFCRKYARSIYEQEKMERSKSQLKFAKACEVLTRGLAHVGIIALIDEATDTKMIAPRML